MKSPLLILGALLCGAAPLVAQEPERRFYLGLDLGQGRINRQYPEFSVEPGSDRQSTAWKLRFGWNLSPHWSFEAGYTDFGDYEGRQRVMYVPGPADEPAAVAPGDLSSSAKGFDISANGTWPLGEAFYLNATTGLMRREFKTVLAPFSPTSPLYRAQDGDLAVRYGLGLGFRLNEAWDLGLDWTTTRDLEGDFEFVVNRSDPTMLSVGVRYRL